MYSNHLEIFWNFTFFLLICIYLLVGRHSHHSSHGLMPKLNFDRLAHFHFWSYFQNKNLSMICGWQWWSSGKARGILIRSLDKISGRRRVESVMEVKLQVCNNPLHTILYLCSGSSCKLSQICRQVATSLEQLQQ